MHTDVSEKLYAKSSGLKQSQKIEELFYYESVGKTETSKRRLTIYEDGVPSDRDLNHHKWGCCLTKLNAKFLPTFTQSNFKLYCKVVPVPQNDVFVTCTYCRR